MSQHFLDDRAVSRISDRVRQLVVEWPSDAPRGSVEEFCLRHGVSRSWFHAVRARAAVEGDAALIKTSTRPRSSPSAVSETTIAAVIAWRRRLKLEGKDYGPLSILDVLDRSGFTPLPSRSTIARILDREHLVERNKRKRPKRSHLRIRSQFPNQRWQSDGVETTLTTGEVVVVIEILDDCTRFNVALHPGPAESSKVVVDAFRRAIDAHGRPVLVHTDNGSAFNQQRSGGITELQTFLGDLGVKMITGRPGHPKSQGKVERAHQTLLNFIEARKPATVEQLAQILDEYRAWYNHDRSHQSLPPRTAPADLYEMMPKVSPPGEPIHPPRKTEPAPPRTAKQERFNAVVQQRIAGKHGQFRYLLHVFQLGKAWAGQTITVVRHDAHLEIFDHAGAWIIDTPWPPARVTTGLNGRINTNSR